MEQRMNKGKRIALLLALGLLALAGLCCGCTNRGSEAPTLVVLLSGNDGGSQAGLERVNRALDEYIYAALHVHVRLEMPDNYTLALEQSMYDGKQIDIAYCPTLENVHALTRDGLLLPMEDLMDRYGQGITELDLPEGLIRIGESAFSHCESLTTVKLPSTITLLEDYCFLSCSSLTSVTSYSPSSNSCYVGDIFGEIPQSQLTVYGYGGDLMDYAVNAGFNTVSMDEPEWLRDGDGRVIAFYTFDTDTVSFPLDGRPAACRSRQKNPVQ